MFTSFVSSTARAPFIAARTDRVGYLAGVPNIRRKHYWLREAWPACQVTYVFDHERPPIGCWLRIVGLHGGAYLQVGRAAAQP